MNDIVPELQFRNDSEKKLFEKVAKFDLMEVDNEDMVHILKINHEKLDQMREDVRYKTIYASLLEEKLEEQETLNQGWDAVEERGLKVILKKLRLGADPEFALKAAAVANKAQRRSKGNRVIDASGVGRVNISLNNMFVLKLRNGETKTHSIDGVPKKSQDFMSPQKIEETLTPRVIEHQPAVNADIDFMDEELTAQLEPAE